MKNARLSAFEHDLLESVRQAENGAHAAAHTPDAIQARERGRPAGSTKPDAKIPATLRLPPDVLARWKATGPGWQTRMVQRLSAP